MYSEDLKNVMQNVITSSPIAETRIEGLNLMAK